MFFLNPHIIASSNGLYGERADQNLAELRAIMKGLIIRERPQSKQSTMWASDMDKLKLDTTPKDASSQTSGGKIWAHTGVYRHNYTAQKKKEPSVKTFSL